MESVPANEWQLNGISEVERLNGLSDPPRPDALIKMVAEEVDRAVASGRISLVWDTYATGRERGTAARVKTLIPVSEPLFDQLFNGRSGYRAQYYLSPDEGHTFNRLIIDTLINALAPLISTGLPETTPTRTEASLKGEHAKLWVAGDDLHEKVFDGVTATVHPPRWVAHWKTLNTNMGLRLPCPPPPQIDLKGAWIDTKSGLERRELGKQDRTGDIHRSGYT